VIGMARIHLVGKKGSKSCKAIRDEVKIPGYFKRPSVLPDILVNYGLAGDRLNSFYKRFPSANKIPMLNKSIGYSKLSVCNRADKQKIPVPESKLTLDDGDKTAEWIEKRTKSIGGIGIRKARGKWSMPGKYYQKFIDKRRYELRVHAFSWIPKTDWRVQKRLGDANEIAWNYKNGGHFVTVQSPKSSKTFVQAWDISNKILDMLGMSFGAVDFLVDTSYNLYFIEINSAPGFSELSKPIYVDAFTRLKQLSKKDILKLVK
jgi:hypothetical protein